MSKPMSFFALPSRLTMPKETSGSRSTSYSSTNTTGTSKHHHHRDRDRDRERDRDRDRDRDREYSSMPRESRKHRRTSTREDPRDQATYTTSTGYSDSESSPVIPLFPNKSTNIPPPPAPTPPVPGTAPSGYTYVYGSQPQYSSGVYQAPSDTDSATATVGKRASSNSCPSCPPPAPAPAPSATTTALVPTKTWLRTTPAATNSPSSSPGPDASPAPVPPSRWRRFVPRLRVPRPRIRVPLPSLRFVWRLLLLIFTGGLIYLLTPFIPPLLTLHLAPSPLTTFTHVSDYLSCTLDTSSYPSSPIAWYLTKSCIDAGHTAWDNATGICAGRAETGPVVKVNFGASMWWGGKEEKEECWERCRESCLGWGARGGAVAGRCHVGGGGVGGGKCWAEYKVVGAGEAKEQRV
ncbi:hypothetical protein BDZ91DRAFT_725441 [Kalaharituber pfeilii]|nr:hypothetical protein BDZ91DRAFT_725441 [Kalaharituber pfeilii]